MENNEFRDRLKGIENDVIVRQLRQIADRIESGRIQLDMQTSQELELELSRVEKQFSVSEILLNEERLKESLGNFASSVQQAINGENSQYAETSPETVGSQITQFLTGNADNPKVESAVRKMITEEDDMEL